ncbi:MAG TPA: heparan-alpha-glucosaminide N-acetyltransferase domain-containing protein [Gammaproteobacteria bacterium]|nr:heparan-alpha-glucosaminide N-acetyltransferase domain-containing protein [Gammaproteobacteria bacterium]
MDMDAASILERTAGVTAPLRRPARALVARAEAGAAAAVARVADVDVLRGFVIVLMALDHVRHYFHSGSPGVDPLDPAQTTPLLYATRWITHLCAPTFVLLAGVSAYLQLARGKTPARLARFLLTRGLWLVALELTAVSFGWSFSFPYPFFLQVIWAIGWSMVALAALVRLPRAAVLAVGVAIVAGHDLLDPLVPEQFGRLGLLWQLLHEGGPIFIGGRPIGAASYPVLPWIGVIALGFGLGPWLARPAAKGDGRLSAGLAMLAAFAVLRGFDLYGDAVQWQPLWTRTASAMSFFDVTKYPPSLDYVLVTLGLVLVLWPALSRLRGPAATFFRTFGAVPMFFYLAHLYLIHGLDIVANAAAGRDVTPLFGYVANTYLRPETLHGLGFGLPTVYAAWLLVLAALYPLCRWFGGVKARRRDVWWLSYL